MKDLTYYLNNTTQTMNGVVFKDEEAFKLKGDEPCYISEYGLLAIQEALENEAEPTVKEMIERGEIATYNSIVKEIEARLDEFAEDENYSKMSIHDIAVDAFNESDWTYISTTLDQFLY